jgi:hypothetical protein
MEIDVGLLSSGRTRAVLSPPVSQRLQRGWSGQPSPIAVQAIETIYANSLCMPENYSFYEFDAFKIVSYHSLSRRVHPGKIESLKKTAENKIE